MMTLRLFQAAVLLPLGLFASAHAAEVAEKTPDRVSFYEEIRPIFQGNCHGCHQPAKAKGDYVMTTFSTLLKGGEEGAAVVPHKAAESNLVNNIMLDDEGMAEMPPKGDPLTPQEVALVERWIEEGAIDDTPANAVERYSPENPPVYERAPVVISIDFSPDGNLLAVSGYHEVLLHKADGSGMVGRLVGLSERIESVKFSPDGTQLAVTGGLPGRMGELQIWDVAKRELTLSLPVGYDTVYGASWSPDGQLVAFGMPDNTVRAVKASNGEQVLYMGGHNDWVLDTVFDQKGEHIISVGRDMSTKLTKVETERFVDNLTSITPGALRGGIGAIVLHPKENHILLGSSDGVPQIYRTKRETARKIGDNANLIRRYPAMPGRVWSVAFRPDGNRFVAGSSLNGKGAVHFYKSEYDATITPELKKAMETARREVGGKVSAQQKLIDEWQTRNAEQLGAIPLDSPVFALAWSPDSKTVVAAGQDGKLRFINPETATIEKEIIPVEIATLANHEAIANADEHPGIDWEKEVVPGEIASLEISPENLLIDGPGRYQQLVVTAHLTHGAKADVTRLATFKVSQPILEFTPRGKALPTKDGQAQLTVSMGGKSATSSVEVRGLATASHPDWIQDVNPVISKMGCNAGTCHGSKDGRAGFKLSLRGYDPLYDVRAFTDDIQSRRTNFASPDDSLMLMKMTGAVPHEGGQLAKQHSTYYNIVRDWIANGAKLDVKADKVASIELIPKNPVIQEIGGRQQFRVVATFANGMKRDVTSEAFVESGNKEVAEHDEYALLNTIRRGEAPILARYEGAYAATTLTVMGKRDGFTWKTPPANNRIDELAAAKWQRLKIIPSELCTDQEFIRRIYLDLTGLPPTSDQVRAFLADKSPQREKRDKVIDSLIGNPEFIDYWTNKWSDMLQVNSKFLGGEGARLFRDWIKTEVAANTPYDEFVYKIITASGSNKENPAASYYKILRDPNMIMENTTHLFLATRFNCNKCHDHPFERWTQDQYYETAAYFSQTGLKRDSKNAPTQNLGGSAVENAKPLYEIVEDMPDGELKHDRTGEVTPPAFPYAADLAPVSFKTAEKPTRREKLGAWITSADNQYFAMSYANRIWGYLLGTGIINPLDDIRAGNPPSNPELLSYLTSEFVKSDFNVRQLMALICKSRTYQLSIETNSWNEDDELNFSHAKAKRLPAEVLYDAVYAVTGAVPNIPGAGSGVRASQLPDAKLDLKSGFLANLGRPVRESACECERNDELQMSAVMAFLSGPAIADAVGSPKSELIQLVEKEMDDRKLIEEIYYRVLSRAPKPGEVNAVLANMQQIRRDHTTVQAQLQARETWWLPVERQRSTERIQRIAHVATQIQTYLPEWTRQKQVAEAAQAKRIAATQKALQDYEKELPKKLEAWKQNFPVSRLYSVWNPLTPKTATSTGKDYSLAIQENGAVLASTEKTVIKQSTDYLLDIDLGDLKDITGFKIEALPHDSLMGFGPGLNPNGNFVVTEIEIQVADANGKFAKQKLVDARTEHIQNGFNVKLTIDGNGGNQKAWAVAGKERQPHAARVKLEKPIANADGKGRIKVRIYNRYGQGDYPLGHFRIWATQSRDPLWIGAPKSVTDAFLLPPASRSSEQNAQIAALHRGEELELLKRTIAYAKEERPLPSDPKMDELHAALTSAGEAIRQDSKLLGLRQDAKYSAEQVANHRLTAAQDLTWALINSPAFLFNR
tara:strand:+ start:4677 stop:9809 length:5133 start_codon:yes stop_codon:yes gene_type:complete